MPPPELLEVEELAPPAPEDADEELEVIEEPEEPEELDELVLIEEPEVVAFDEPELDVAELDSPPLPPDPPDFEPQEHAPIAARAKVKGKTA